MASNRVKKNKSPFPDSVKAHGKGPVRYAFPQGPDGPFSIGIDFSSASVPGSYYYADAFSLRRDREFAMVTLSFGRFDTAGGRLRDRLDLVMPEAALFFQFWNSSRDVEKVLDEQLKTLGIAATTRSISPKSLARTTFFANIIFVSTGGGESCLDFYYLPIRDVHLAKASQSSKTKQFEIGLDPIIRILLSPSLLKLLFNVCRPHAITEATKPLALGRTDRANAS
jgi:hypothetical protein